MRRVYDDLFKRYGQRGPDERIVENLARNVENENQCPLKTANIMGIDSNYHGCVYNEGVPPWCEYSAEQAVSKGDDS